MIYSCTKIPITIYLKKANNKTVLLLGSAHCGVLLDSSDGVWSVISVLLPYKGLNNGPVTIR